MPRKCTSDTRRMSELRNLSKEQLAAYERDGFLVIENFASAEQIQQLKSQITSIIDKTDPSTIGGIFATGNKQLESVRNDYFVTSSDKIRPFFEARALDDQGTLKVPLHLAINKIGHALHSLDPVFSDFTHQKKCRDILLDVGLKRPVVPQSMYIFKQPHTGGEVTPHQDSSFMHTTPISCHALWIALDDATTENGCLWAIPGSHSEPVRHLFKLKSDKSGVYYDPPVTEDSFRSIWPRDKYVALPVKAGSCVVIHGSVIHMSEDNFSDKGRHVYTFHVVDGEAEWDRENWLQYPNNTPFQEL